MSHIPTHDHRPRPRVLYVNTTDAACKLLNHVFRERDFDFVACRDPVEALGLLDRQDFHVVVASYQDHRLDPLDFLRQSRRRQPHAFRVQVLPEASADVAVRAIREASLSRFIQKSWSVWDIDRSITQLAEEAEGMIERQELEKRCQRLEGEIDRLKATLDEVSARGEDRALNALLTALGFREYEARRHSFRSAHYARILGREHGLDPDCIRPIWQGALLHDLGKIGISDQILLKPGALTSQEWDEMRWHPALGHGLLNNFAFLEEARTIVLQHHERWDGDGYPAGLRGDQIHVGARICAVADSVDAMTNNRPYRQAMDFDDAWDEVLRCSGTQFDPGVVEIFAKMGRTTWAGIIAKKSGNGHNGRMIQA